MGHTIHTRREAESLLRFRLQMLEEAGWGDSTEAQALRIVLPPSPSTYCTARSAANRCLLPEGHPGGHVDNHEGRTTLWMHVDADHPDMTTGASI